jgi:hypothetical protein
VNRSDFQELAELHLQHARALLDAQLYSGAYYMCGYVVECALKAVFANVRRSLIFIGRPMNRETLGPTIFRSLSERLGSRVSLGLHEQPMKT